MATDSVWIWNAGFARKGPSDERTPYGQVLEVRKDDEQARLSDAYSDGLSVWPGGTVMNAHTPGPWKWTWQEERTCYALKGEHGQVLEITKGLTPTIADQRLIAAAPRMLEVIRALVSSLALDRARAILREIEGQ